MEVIGDGDALKEWLIARLKPYGISLEDLEPEFKRALLQDLPDPLPAQPEVSKKAPTAKPLTICQKCRSFAVEPFACQTCWNFMKGSMRNARSDLVDMWRSMPLQLEKLVVKVSVQLLILTLSIWYAIDVIQNKYPEAIDTFSGYVFVARLAGFACALETGLLYGSMARRGLSKLSRWVLPRDWPMCKAMLEGHQEIHVGAGMAVNLYGFLHAGCHLLGTVPALLKRSAEELNNVIGCAQENPPFWLHLSLEFLEWPPCPLEEDTRPHNFLEALFMTMPAVTGLLLCTLLLLVSITAYFRDEKSRKQIRCNFDYKWFKRAHLLAIWVWPVLLFLHGSQQWIGIGAPLALFDLVLVAIFGADRARQTHRCRTTIRRVIVLEGPKGPSWVHIDADLPGNCCFLPGMVAKIAFPSISSEFHSFSITTGTEKGVIGFTFQAVYKDAFLEAGDWCRPIGKRLALDAADPTRPLPPVSIHGGFTAAMQWALRQPVVVVIGLNRGITPVVSVACALAAGCNKRLVEAVCLFESYFSDHLIPMHPELLAASRAHSNQVSMHFFLTPNSRDAQDAHFRTWLTSRRHSSGHAVLHARLSPSPLLTARPQLSTKETDETYRMLTLGSPDYAQQIGDLADRNRGLGVDVFVCGNPDLQSNVAKACQRCQTERPGQPIRLHME